jgi:K+ transporter
MAGTWHHPGNRPSWWARHWANPSFSGSLIAVTSVLLVIAAALYIGAEALHLDLGHLGFASLLGR